MAVGESIRRLRAEQGMTQVELSEKSGLSSNYIARLERGEVGASLYVGQRLCEALDTDLAILTDTEHRGRTTKRRAR